MSTSKKRRLAAILFADIVGYTTLMEKDETKANHTLEKFYRTLNSKVDHYKGQVINNYGDGCVCTFDSAVAAMNCAKEVQLIFQTAPNIPVRIGLHSGDVFFKEDNVFGETVNLASRIETLGIPGAVLFSNQIKRHISNHPEFKVQSLGEFRFKNVEKAIEVFALTNEGLTIPKQAWIQAKLSIIKKSNWLAPLIAAILLLMAWGIGRLSSSKPTFTEKNSVSHTIPSIAVLPFDDMSPNKDQIYFANGISEEILNTLANLTELKVAGRTSSFSFRDKEATIKEIGKALNVDHVLEGSIRKQGDKIRITAQLIKVDDGFHIWSEKYDRDFDDIFAIQDELAQSIGEVLLEKLAPEQINQLKTTLPRNSEAYELFLRGKHVHWNLYRSIGNLQKDFDLSEQFFLKAIEIDSTYALAHAGLSDLYDTHVGKMMKLGDTEGEQRYRALSKEIGDLAFQLNPELSYVNTVRGYTQINQKEFLQAFKSLLRGVELSPNNPDAIFGLQYFYRSLGFYDDAIQIGDKLKEIDPLFETGLVENLFNNYLAGNVEQTILDGQYLVDIKKNSTKVMEIIFWNYFTANKKVEALAVLENIYKVDPAYDTPVSMQLWYELVKENKSYIEKTLKEGSNYDKFIIHNFYEDDEKAEVELRLVIEEMSKKKYAQISIQFTDYLKFSKNKLFKKYQDKDWFKQGIAPKKKVYEYLAKNFPRAEEVIEQLNNKGLTNN